jgi:antitoxin VapB
MTAPRTAKLFTNGRSQAVRLPREFRFSGNEVAIRRDEATGDVLLSSITNRVSEQEIPGSGSAEAKTADRKLSLKELFAIFDQAEFPEDFFEREKHLPRELDLF